MSHRDELGELLRDCRPGAPEKNVPVVSPCAPTGTGSQTGGRTPVVGGTYSILARALEEAQANYLREQAARRAAERAAADLLPPPRRDNHDLLHQWERESGNDAGEIYSAHNERPTAAEIDRKRIGSMLEAAAFTPTSDMYLNPHTAETAKSMQEIADRATEKADEQKKLSADLYGELNEQRRKTNRAFWNTVLSTPTVPYAPSMNETAWAEYNENARKLKPEEDKLHAMGGAGDYEIIPGAVHSAHAGYVNAAATLKDFLNQYYVAPTVLNSDGTVNWEASVKAHQPSETVQAAVDRLHDKADELQERASISIAGVKAGRGIVGSILTDVGVSGLQMAGDALINEVVPGGGLAAMGVRAFGNAAQEARQRGADVARQAGYGAAVAGVEILSEKLFDGLAGIYGKGGADKMVEKVIKRMAKSEGGQKVLKWLSSVAGEGFEELFSGVIDPGLETIIDSQPVLSHYNNETKADIIQSVIVGAILGGLGGSVEIASDIANPEKQKAIEIQEAQADEAEISQQAKSVYDYYNKIVQKYGLFSMEAQIARDTVVKPLQERMTQHRRANPNEATPTQQEYEDARAGEAGRFFSGMGPEAVQTVIDEGLDSEPGTESRRLAEEYDKKIKAGSQLTPEEIGKLYRANIEAIERENLQQQAAQNAETVSRYAAQLEQSGEITPLMADTLNNMYSASQDFSGYTGEMTAAYNAGRAGTDVNSVATNTITPEQRQAAYLAGQGARNTQARVSAQQTTTDTTTQETGAQAQKKPAVRVSNPGFVQDEVSNRAKLTHLQKRALDTIGKTLGVRVRMVESITTTDADGTVRKSGAQGYYDNGEIVLARDADDPFLVTAVHESVHRIRELSESDYAYLSGFVTRNMSDSSYGLAEIIKGRDGYSTEEIPEEIIADAFGRMLGNEKAMRQFVAENSTAAQRIMDVFADIFDKIRTALTGGDGRALTENQKKVYQDLAGRFDVMMKYYRDAVANVQESEGTANSGAKHSMRRIVGASGTDYGMGVYLDSDLLDGLTPSERKAMVKARLDEMSGTPITAYDANDNPVQIQFAKNSEQFRNASGRRHPVNQHLYNMADRNETRAAIVAQGDEAIQTGRQGPAESAIHPHGWLDDNGSNDWEPWKVIFQEKNNSIWEATFKVANSSDGRKIPYDVTQMNMLEGPRIIGTPSSMTLEVARTLATPSAGTNVTQDVEKSNTQNRKHSLRSTMATLNLHDEIRDGKRVWVDEDAAPVRQAHTSRGTSINVKKVPALYSKATFQPGTVNIDIGAGVEGTPAMAYLDAQGHPYAVNVGIDGGKKFKIDMTKAPAEGGSSVTRIASRTNLPKAGASKEKVTQPRGKSKGKFSLKAPAEQAKTLYRAPWPGWEDWVRSVRRSGQAWSRGELRRAAADREFAWAMLRAKYDSDHAATDEARALAAANAKALRGESPDAPAIRPGETVYAEALDYVMDLKRRMERENPYFDLLPPPEK